MKKRTKFPDVDMEYFKDFYLFNFEIRQNDSKDLLVKQQRICKKIFLREIEYKKDFCSIICEMRF